VGIAAFIGGASSILRALQTRRWHLLVTGVLWIILAAVLFTQTQASAAVLVWIAGAFFLLFGLLLLYLAYRLRRAGKTIGEVSSAETVIEGQVIEGEIVE
jgi:uncharacterized membrane protein HdeD (DUF308 family)